MKQIYFDTPDAAIAANYKVASSSLARAIIAAHHPEIETMLNTPPGTGKGVAYPAGKSADNTRWHGQCPKVDPSEREIHLLLVRDPIEKFRSACVEGNIDDIDALLTELEAGFWRRAHFWPQSRFLEDGDCKCYKFPDDLSALATVAGLAWPLPDIDGGNSLKAKPTLNKSQIKRVKKLYADDISLFVSIKTVGQLVTARAEVSAPEETVTYAIPATDPVKAVAALAAEMGISQDRINQIIQESGV